MTAIDVSVLLVAFFGGTGDVEAGAGVGGLLAKRTIHHDRGLGHAS